MIPLKLQEPTFKGTTKAHTLEKSLLQILKLK